MHVLTLLRGDTVRPPVSIVLLEDSFHVEAPSMAGLMCLGNKMADPTQSNCPIRGGLRFIGEHLSAKSNRLRDVKLLSLKRCIERQSPRASRSAQIGRRAIRRFASTASGYGRLETLASSNKIAHKLVVKFAVLK